MQEQALCQVLEGDAAVDLIARSRSREGDGVLVCGQLVVVRQDLILLGPRAVGGAVGLAGQHVGTIVGDGDGCATS